MSAGRKGVTPEWNLADRLVKARKTAVMTQADLAARLGMSTRTVQRYEDGSYVPSDEQVQQWANACGVNAGWLRDG